MNNRPRFQRGITFAGAHSFRELGLTLKSKTIGNPKKVKNIVKIPYSNIEYDLTDIYKIQPYENRKLTYVFNIWHGSTGLKEHMNALKIAALNKYMPVNTKAELRDDDIAGFHFLAELRDDPSFTERDGKGELTLVFDAYPFKISDTLDPNDEWDPFCFLYDVAQNEYNEIKGYRRILLYNNSMERAIPVIESTAPLVIKTDKGKEYKVPTGVSEFMDYKLERGDNFVEVTGYGTISFRWRKEMI